MKTQDRFAWAASTKQFDKEVALYLSKKFIADTLLIDDVGGYSKFSIESTSSDRRRELTSSLFKSKHISGLILGFFSNYGDAYLGEGGSRDYGFKYLDANNAFKLLNRIQYIIENQRPYLTQDFDGNNIYFSFDDMRVIIYMQNNSTTGFRIRIFWKNFDSEWVYSSFKDTRAKLIKTYGLLEPVNKIKVEFLLNN
tara:strand:- start:10 stop:597 length:588 start_codon:yes stop_codon:yes gene_type:complete